MNEVVFMDRETLIDLIKSYFSGMNDALSMSINMLMQSPGEFSPMMEATVDSIFAVLLSTSYVLIVLFFIIDLANKTVMLETQNYEVIAKLLLRFLLAKVIVENCRGIMYAIYYSFQKVLNSVAIQGGSPLGDGAQQAVLDHVNQMDGGIFGLNFVVYYMQMMPTFLIVWVVSLIAGVIVIGRMFEIMIYSAVAPLPLATLAGEATTDTAKHFTKNYVALCLQGIIIIIAFRLFGAVIADVYTGNTNMGVYLMLVIVFALTVIKSGTWSKQIAGAM
jgi:hypothetical protein